MSPVCQMREKRSPIERNRSCHRSRVATFSQSSAAIDELAKSVVTEVPMAPPGYRPCFAKCEGPWARSPSAVPGASGRNGASFRRSALLPPKWSIIYKTGSTPRCYRRLSSSSRICARVQPPQENGCDPISAYRSCSPRVHTGRRASVAGVCPTKTGVQRAALKGGGSKGLRLKTRRSWHTCVWFAVKPHHWMSGGFPDAYSSVLSLTTRHLGDAIRCFVLGRSCVLEFQDSARLSGGATNSHSHSTADHFDPEVVEEGHAG